MAFKESVLDSQEVVQKCRDLITRHLDNSIYDEGSPWYNEYYGRELSKSDTDDFKIITMLNTDHTALFFKILPAKKKVSFSGTKATTNWDGFFTDVERDSCNELIQKLNQSCRDKNTKMVNGVNGWGIDKDEKRVWVAPKFGMFLA